MLNTFCVPTNFEEKALCDRRLHLWSIGVENRRITTDTVQNYQQKLEPRLLRGDGYAQLLLPRGCPLLAPVSWMKKATKTTIHAPFRLHLEAHFVKPEYHLQHTYVGLDVNDKLGQRPAGTAVDNNQLTIGLS